MFGEGEGEITITTEGKRHIGAVIGTEEFEEQYLIGPFSAGPNAALISWRR